MKNLSKKEYDIYNIILQLHRGEDKPNVTMVGIVQKSREKSKKGLGYSLATVYRVITDLKEKGFIEVELIEDTYEGSIRNEVKAYSPLIPYSEAYVSFLDGQVGSLNMWSNISLLCLIVGFFSIMYGVLGFNWYLYVSFLFIVFMFLSIKSSYANHIESYSSYLRGQIDSLDSIRNLSLKDALITILDYSMFMDGKVTDACYQRKDSYVEYGYYSEGRSNIIFINKNSNTFSIHNRRQDFSDTNFSDFKTVDELLTYLSKHLQGNFKGWYKSLLEAEQQLNSDNRLEESEAKLLNNRL